MDKFASSPPGTARFSPWLPALLGVVAVKAILTISLKSVPLVYSYSGISYLLLLLLATGFSVRNAIHDALRARPFWVLLAAGCGLWAFHQFLDLYYVLGLHTEIPDNSIADEVLFAHLVPFIAAAASLWSLHRSDHHPRRWVMNTLLILALWSFLYGFVIAPYKFFGSRNYGSLFDILYLAENLALILAAGLVALRAPNPWKRIGLHLVGASALYALSSTFANFASDIGGGYINGKLYGLGLTASVCWYVWIPLSARVGPGTQPGTQIDAPQFPDKQDSQASGWAMLAVVLIAFPMAWELLQRNENPNISTLRLIVATAAIVLLAGGAYLMEYLDKRELSAERTRAELALRASEERFRLAAQAARMYAVEWDVNTDRFVRSGELPGVIGMTNEELGPTLQQFLMRVHPDDRARVAASVTHRDPEHPSTRIRFRLVRPDGSVVWVERTDHALFNEQRELVRMVGMVANVTEQKHAEDALRESEEKFRSVFQDVGVGMVIVSPDGRYLAANPAFCRDLGYTEAELLTKTVESITFAEDWPSFSAKLKKALEVGEGFLREEKRCLHKSGRIVYTESSAALIRDSEGKPLYFVGEANNVTASREWEQMLASFNRRLIQTQEEERARIARELHDDISQRVALLAIRLGTIKTLPGALPADILEQVAKTQQETTELSMCIQHLSHDLHSSTLNLVGLSAAIRSWCSEVGERRNLEILFESRDVPAPLPHELAVQLYRVFQEALNNAAKHSGVKRIDVRLWATPAELHLSVSDLGRGFDVNAMLSGRGLGLTYMRERMKLMNGSLDIESAPNAGATIHAQIPLTT